MNQHHYAVILAGGIGSRFWPMSRQNKPKQFLDILGIGETFIQSSYNRLLEVFLPENIMVVTHNDYIQTIREQLPNLLPANILAEPFRRNTTAAVAFAAHKLHALDPDSILLIAPSDHFIADTGAYLNILRNALEVASENKLLTIGITPTRPDTGYGYIEYDIAHESEGFYKVKRFTEKPSLETAIRFISEGDYLWNSGMFIWKSSNIIKALNLYCPKLNSLFENIVWGKEDEVHSLNEVYTQCDSVSIDYSVMEKAENVYVIPGQFGWSDVGTWASLFNISGKTESDNVHAETNIIIQECENCIIKSDNQKATVIKGLKDYIVVDTPDALLIYPKSKEQELREVLDYVKVNIGESYL